MTEAFYGHLDTNFPFLKDANVLVAVSGGIDSVVLTYLMQQYARNIALAHCNFKLRNKESDEDEKFVVALGENLGIPVFTKRFETTAFAASRKLSTQMAARELRYEWFEILMEKNNFQYLLTAHHADDNLETFLINLSRGSGLEGLKGIPETNAHILRPLLPFSRMQIETYAKDQDIEWREDSSNAESKYLRNNLRNNIIPLLKEIHPGFLDNFNKTIDIIKGDAAILEAHIRELRSVYFIKEGSGRKVPVAQLKKLTPLKAYLHAFFNNYGFTAWDDIAELLNAQSGKFILSPTHRMLKDREYLIIQPLDALSEVNTRVYTINKGRSRIFEPLIMSFESVEAWQSPTAEVIYVDEGKISYPLKLRKWKEGDRFYPYGMKGSKKISKYFKDEKYSLDKKEAQWLLCTADDQIIWVIGSRADDRFGKDKESSDLLKISLHR